MSDGKASPQVLRVQERIRPCILRDRQSVGVVRSKEDRLPHGAGYGKVLKVVEVKGLMKKRKMKMYEEDSAFKAVRSRKFGQHFLPEGKRPRQLLRPSLPDAMAALGCEQRRRKMVATD